MNRHLFSEMVSGLQVGKQLPDAIYIHRSALKSESTDLHSLIEGVAKSAGIGPRQWNVVKLAKRDQRISLLNYRNFFDAPFPELSKSHVIDIETGKTRSTDYSKSDNPPILHRKELLLGPGHRRFTEYQKLTESAEVHGLFSNPKRIGFRKQWQQLIKNRGLTLVDGTIVPAFDRPNELVNDGAVGVQRHLTAIDRNKLSAPMQLIAQHGYLDGSYSVLDYGCGKGDDVRELEAHGIDVVGWDPVFANETKVRNCDVVNLGFVLNVIENPKERAEALDRAFKLADKLLIVSVMLGGEATNERFTEFGDGVITSRNTFQKYFSQPELKSYIEQVLGESPVAGKPGIFLVFRDKVEEQEFLLERQHVRREWRHLTARPPSKREYLIPKEKIDSNLPLFEDFWQAALDFGRVPANDEFDFSDQLRALAGSHKRAFESLKEHFDTSEFEQASMNRQEDLTVFFALANFDRRTAYVRFAPRLKRDISYFFGNYGSARDAGDKLLYSIAELNKIRAGCVTAAKSIRSGRVQPGHSYTIHRKFLDELPSILRVYVGCAALLYGEVDTVDLIKVHYTSPKVTFLMYEDFSDSRLPILRERVKVNLSTQRIDFFSNNPERDEQLLYFKSEFQAIDDRDPDQVAFDQSLRQIITLDENGLGPSLSELETLLS